LASKLQDVVIGSVIAVPSVVISLQRRRYLHGNFILGHASWLLFRRRMDRLHAV